VALVTVKKHPVSFSVDTPMNLHLCS
jgi:hypothetical protein